MDSQTSEPFPQIAIYYNKIILLLENKKLITQAFWGLDGKTTSSFSLLMCRGTSGTAAGFRPILAHYRIHTSPVGQGLVESTPL